jgi:6-phosphogluconolactonase
MRSMCMNLNRRASVLLMVSISLMPALTQRVFAATGDKSGAVFTLTNNPQRNEVLMYNRAADGQLTRVGAFPTDGRGSGGTVDPLTANYEIVLNEDHSLLLAVNAGSGSISVFRVGDDGLHRLSVTHVQTGSSPNSIAIHGDLVYVGNLVGSFGLEGFHLDSRTGELHSIPDSATAISGLFGYAPATVKFSPDGKKLVVTERVTNQIDVYSVSEDGYLHDPVFNTSLKLEPFGFTFTAEGILLILETNQGLPSGSFVTSYSINPDNTLKPISRSVTTSGLAACWVSWHGKYLYTSNTATGNLGALEVQPNGALTAAGIGVSLDKASTPLDSSFSDGGKYLYVLFGGLGQIIGFEAAGGGGQLAPIANVQVSDPSQGFVGIAAY